MRWYGFDDHALQWFGAYLSKRRQYVSLQTSKSDEIKVGPYACPQGSGLGPLCWNLYCGEVAEVLSIKERIDDDGVMKMGGREGVMNKIRTWLLVQYADDIMFLIQRDSRCSEGGNIWSL